ncbi:hypothetical protein [Streptacidiphilus albus]|uniref:hypothetical protein n=1 Tax=Streptacidiphilus albus TaxID=105425 RepID=UPI00128B0FA4|nr:hypothetical protein [Streptacidiphilus albus]
MPHHLDPAVTAAWIAAGTSIVSLAGTVFVAYRGFRATEKVATEANQSAERNTERFVVATRDDHLWEKRADTYVEALSYVHHRGATRQHAQRGYRMDQESEARIAALLDSYDPGSWFELEGRLTTFASDEVVAASNAAHQANQKALIALGAWQELERQARESTLGGSAGPTGEAVLSARESSLEATKAAEAEDLLLITQIRRELHSHPRQ